MKFTCRTGDIIDSEEMEILANEEIMTELRESEKEIEKGKFREFHSIDELRKFLNL